MSSAWAEMSIASPPEALFTHPGDELDAGHIGQAEIDDEEVDRGPLESGQGLFPVFSQVDPIFFPQNQKKRLPDGFLVIHDDDFSA